MDMIRETLFSAEDDDRRRVIDLEWVTENEFEGYYELKVINFTPVYDESEMGIIHEYHTDTPHYILKSTNRSEIVDEMNRLMWFLPRVEEERILKAPGKVDEPSESFRLMLVEHGPNPELCEKIIKLGNKQIQILLIEHPDITPEVLQSLIDSGAYVKTRKKAGVLLNSKRFKKKHGL